MQTTLRTCHFRVMMAEMLVLARMTPEVREQQHIAEFPCAFAVHRKIEKTILVFRS